MQLMASCFGMLIVGTILSNRQSESQRGKVRTFAKCRLPTWWATKLDSIMIVHHHAPQHPHRRLDKFHCNVTSIDLCEPTRTPHQRPFKPTRSHGRSRKDKDCIPSSLKLSQGEETSHVCLNLDAFQNREKKVNVNGVAPPSLLNRAGGNCRFKQVPSNESSGKIHSQWIHC